MAVVTESQREESETTYQTKRVFMRAEHNDEIEITEVVSRYSDETIPRNAAIVKRDIAYYGPKLRIKEPDSHEHYLITAPGPSSQALVWSQANSGWEKMAEVCLDFDGPIPQYDICPRCNEPLSTVEHRRRSIIGTCSNN